MAADYIQVSRDRQLGNSLVRSADLLREIRELVDKLNDSGGHCVEGGDFSLLESQFGLQPGTGANVATLIGLVWNILNTSADVAGAQRQANLDEFVGRLAGQ